MAAVPEDALEILPVDLLETHRARAEELRRLAHTLVIPLGWHYLLDLVWILERLGPVNGRRILDAGAGIGVIQWHLAQQGADVISVDRGDRQRLPLHLRRRYHVRGLRRHDLASPLRAALDPRALLRSCLSIARGGLAAAAPGQVTLYHEDLSALRDVADASVDAVVSVSALEHNPPERLGAVVAELRRVLKPGGVLLATLAAAPAADWYHEPSSGWCYSEATLRRQFDLAPDVRSNYARYEELLRSLRDSRELRRGLAWYYYRSGRNGMPWGRWDPAYQPVGVCKVKA
jgi:SAM-dependent methyltransferase